MLFHPCVAPADECANRGRRRIKDRDAVFLNDLPKAIGLRPIWCPFIHDRGRAIGKRSVNDVAVTRNPPDVGRAPVDVLIPDVEDIFHRGINPDQVTAGRMQDSLRLSGGTAGVENVERMLGIEPHRRAMRIDVLQFAMPPNIATLLHVDLVARASVNNHALHRCAPLKRFIHILLERHDRSTPITPVCCD